MKFTKMHGCGNDYIYVNGAAECIADERKPGLAVSLSDRHFGIGADGIIFVNPSERADFEMEMYNADGSRGRMCGNGIRCVAKFAYDKGLTDKTGFCIESFDSKIGVMLVIENGEVKGASVDMGEPVLEPERIPVKAQGVPNIISKPLEVINNTYNITCVSMGNPHAVVFIDEGTKLSFPGIEEDTPCAFEAGAGMENAEGQAGACAPGGSECTDYLPSMSPCLQKLRITDIGPHFEKHPFFPEGVNTEFIVVKNRSELDMRVWERGSGETFACGTGACACAVAAILNGLTDRQVTVHLRGGDLKIVWDEASNHVYMEGPATTVFEGEAAV